MLCTLCGTQGPGWLAYPLCGTSILPEPGATSAGGDAGVVEYLSALAAPGAGRIRSAAPKAPRGVVIALTIAGFLLAPAGRSLFKESRDK
ncbi:hypothetical protein GCM10010324_21610 [Streptomyces hiroshimensis]|uniref:Uncharacterized protein n=1 Tax=Streptomyces hiroshimensis TaxID=66424 RepID=A0ABQ2Y8R8_9ACTN|nr:hypothetical protein GCM10010324_21610 [Streptomyces hiroshimensis]